jgi:hypothetical protein
MAGPIPQHTMGGAIRGGYSAIFLAHLLDLDGERNTLA